MDTNQARLGLELFGKKTQIIKAHLQEKKLVLDEVQLEGKSPVSWRDFASGYPNVAFGKD